MIMAEQQWMCRVGCDGVAGFLYEDVRKVVVDLMQKHGIEGDPDELIRTNMQRDEVHAMLAWRDYNSDWPSEIAWRLEHKFVPLAKAEQEAQRTYYGRRVVDEDERLYRLEICKKCKAYWHPFCMVCGAMDGIRAGMGKDYMPTKSDFDSGVCTKCGTFCTVVCGTERLPSDRKLEESCWR